eukprot:TRINITY_DN34878_c0_g2_i1.p1 TRINITY_DN34878_c0_g2~~TRINITY_DN34878_c0_g2_i1.p1  ORF type:complete len:712 (-),score=73.18 TRINITY_DN34878_c0_g2_i1:9-2144(-)
MRVERVASDRHEAPEGWGMDGDALHKRVPSHRWCVTKADLKDFRRQIVEALDEKRLKPSTLFTLAWDKKWPDSGSWCEALSAKLREYNFADLKTGLLVTDKADVSIDIRCDVEVGGHAIIQADGHIVEDRFPLQVFDKSHRSWFDANDRIFGPNVYSVNEQFIKPRTKIAGGMSWALMLHPDGIKCDLFVTHAWQEGIFEFIDKVLHSWPPGRFGAYICFLSNPQNLDISGLIASPQDSPFAHALDAASHMLVVTNRFTSIYGRLWCAYEAFLACVKGKIIMTALASTSKKTRLAMLSAFRCLLVGGFCLKLAEPFFRFLNSKSYLPCSSAKECGTQAGVLITPFSLLLTHPKAWRIANLSGAAVSGAPWWELLHAMYAILFTVDARRTDWRHECLLPLSASRWRIGNLCLLECLFLVFFFAEIDRVQDIERKRQAEELEKGFSSAEHARCSSAEDEKNIFHEICSHVRQQSGKTSVEHASDHGIAQVDHSVRVLIDATMSTPSLRKAAQLGVVVHGAAKLQLSHTFAGWFLWIYASNFDGEGVCRWLDPAGVVMWEWLKLCFPLSWLLIFLVLPKDQMSFASASMTKILLLWTCVFCGCAYLEAPMGKNLHKWVYGSLHHLHHQDEAPFAATFGPFLILAGTCVITVSLVGIGGVAMIPVCGPSIAQFLSATSLATCLEALYLPCHKAIFFGLEVFGFGKSTAAQRTKQD